MKQYAVFFGDTMLTFGGWRDFKGSADSVKEARKLVPVSYTGDDSWWQIVDTHTGLVVKSFKGSMINL